MRETISLTEPCCKPYYNLIQRGQCHNHTTSLQSHQSKPHSHLSSPHSYPSPSFRVVSLSCLLVDRAMDLQVHQYTTVSLHLPYPLFPQERANLPLPNQVKRIRKRKMQWWVVTWQNRRNQWMNRCHILYTVSPSLSSSLFWVLTVCLLGVGERGEEEKQKRGEGRRGGEEGDPQLIGKMGKSRGKLNDPEYRLHSTVIFRFVSRPKKNWKRRMCSRKHFTRSNWFPHQSIISSLLSLGSREGWSRWTNYRIRIIGCRGSSSLTPLPFPHPAPLLRPKTSMATVISSRICAIRWWWWCRCVCVCGLGNCRNDAHNGKCIVAVQRLSEIECCWFAHYQTEVCTMLIQDTSQGKHR